MRLPVKTALWATLFFFIACPAFAATTIKTAVVWSEVAGTDHSAYSAHLPIEIHLPSGPGPFPAVILMHGSGGYGPSARKNLGRHAAYLNRNGFAAVMVDSFSPRDVVIRAPEHKLSARAVAQFNAARLYRQYDAVNVAAAMAARSDIDGGNLFLMGQSQGGSVAVRLSQAGSAVAERAKMFRALAAFYPWCGAFDKPPTLRLPLIVITGNRDTSTPPARCRAMRPHLPADDYRFVEIPGATHAFDAASHRRRGEWRAFNSQAMEQARTTMLTFFLAHLVPRR
jgi:dienelactone hydrolase